MRTTNPTNLDLSFILPAVQGFDYAGLKAWAEGIKAKYADVVVMEDQVIGTKAEMAELNRIKKQLDAARIAAVKKVSEPIRDFEAQVKEVCAIFDATYAYLGEQVKGYEERAREEKRREVLFAIEALTAEAGYPGLAIPVQESWLNKTAKPKQTAAEIGSIILAHIKAERDAKALEQAKQDRAVAIENQLAALTEAAGFSIPASQFIKLYDLEVPLTEVVKQTCLAYTVKAEANARANVPPVPPTAPLAAPAAHVQSQGASAIKTLDIAIVYDASKESEVNMALRHLQTLCVSFSPKRDVELTRAVYRRLTEV